MFQQPAGELEVPAMDAPPVAPEAPPAVDKPKRGRRAKANGEAKPAKETKARGRKDKSGQEKLIKISELDERMPNLVGLYTTMNEARTQFSEAVKATAEKSGLFAAMVRKFVVAKAGDHFDERRDEAYQLSLIFGESKAA